MSDQSPETPAETPAGPPRHGDSPERIPFMQRLLDSPFLLLFIGVTIPTVLYLIWGMMEIASIPLAE